MKVSLITLSQTQPRQFTSIMRKLDEEIAEKEDKHQQLAEDEGYTSVMNSSSPATISDDDIRQMFATLVDE